MEIITLKKEAKEYGLFLLSPMGSYLFKWPHHLYKHYTEEQGRTNHIQTMATG